jgi:hypothetical protein
MVPPASPTARAKWREKEDEKMKGDVRHLQVSHGVTRHRSESPGEATSGDSRRLRTGGRPWRRLKSPPAGANRRGKEEKNDE